MEDQVSNVCRNCYLSLRQISQIRPYLTEEATASSSSSKYESSLSTRLIGSECVRFVEYRCARDKGKFMVRCVQLVKDKTSTGIGG